MATDWERLPDKLNTSQGDSHHSHQFKPDCSMAVCLEHRENAASLYLSEVSSATLTPSPHTSHSQRLQLLATVLYTNHFDFVPSVGPNPHNTVLKNIIITIMQNIHTSSDIKLQNTHRMWLYYSYVARTQILFLGVGRGK